MLALFRRSFPARLRTYLLTVTVVDDIVALVVIAFVYTEDLKAMPLLVALAIFAVIVVVRALGVGQVPVYVLLSVAAWVALSFSGVEPILLGLALGMLTFAYPATRVDLEFAQVEKVA